jgi:hypothetical protein
MVKDENIPLEKITFLDGFETANDFDFRLQKNIPSLNVEDVSKRNDAFYVVSGDAGFKALQSHHTSMTLIGKSTNYGVSKLSSKFLNPATRTSVLNNLYLIRIN